MKGDVRLAFLLLVALWLAVGCGSVPKVRRTAVDETIDLSGRWNDSDSRMVADEMIKDCLNRPWLVDFQSRKGRKPAVIVGRVVNRSDEHINTQVFIKDLERALTNSGLVDFVASRDERRELREERADMQLGFSSTETAKRMGREIGADFMLKGTLNSVRDQITGQYVILYQVNLEIYDLETNRKHWIGQKKLKKVVSRSRWKL
jgi:PBP1b-binding outer membrane lipoprotein LpoB